MGVKKKNLVYCIYYLFSTGWMAFYTYFPNRTPRLCDLQFMEEAVGECKYL